MLYIMLDRGIRYKFDGKNMSLLLNSVFMSYQGVLQISNLSKLKQAR